MTTAHHDVIVVGGGIAGLTCAYQLKLAGVDAVVLEAQSTPGGNTQSQSSGGFVYEYGPHTFPASAEAIFSLVNQLGLDSDIMQTAQAGRVRFVVRHSQVHKVPSSLWALFTTRLISWRAKFAMIAEPLRRGQVNPSDTVHSFFSRRIGEEAATVFGGAFVNGVYAGDAHKLSARSAFPLLWSFEQGAGSLIIGAWRHFRKLKRDRAESNKPPRKGLFSFKGGIGRLTVALASALNDRFVSNKRVDSLEFSDGLWLATSGESTYSAKQVVLAVPPNCASSLLENVSPVVAGQLQQIPMAPIAVVHLGYRDRQPALPDGFGLLVAPKESTYSLGILFPSRLFSDRAPANGELISAFVGGVGNPVAIDLPDAALTERVKGDLDHLFGLRCDPEVVQVLRYKSAIPQFTDGHASRIATISKGLADNPGLHLAGNYLTGVGLKDAVHSGLAASKACMESTG